MLPDEPTGGLTIVFEQEAGPSAALVRDRLDMHNVAATGVSAFYPLHFYVRSARGETLGGLLGFIWGGWLQVNHLWVDPAVRGRGWGGRLLDEAEAYGRSRGARSAWLDTHTFQAPAFYERRGYVVFGQLDDLPPGHRRLFLKKPL